MPKKKSKERSRERTEIQHTFNAEEWKDRADRLTRAMKEVEIKEEQVKATAAIAKADIKQIKANVNDLANQLRNGYELREVDCVVEFNRTKATKKFYLHKPGDPEHGKLIKQAAMTEQDFERLPLDEEPQKREPAPSLEEVTAIAVA